MRLLSARNLYRFHAYGGLWLGAHFLLFLVTGFVLLFKPAAEFKVAGAAATLNKSYSEILRESLARFPGERPLSLFPDEEVPRVLHLRLSPDGSGKFRGARKLDFDLRSGAEVKGALSETGFFSFVLRLHRELLLGSAGKILVGISGIILLLISLSGFLIYGRFRRGQAFDSVRFGSKPLLLADLHKWLGAAAGAWVLLVTFTGIFLAFNSLLIKLYQAQNLASLSQAYQGHAASADPALVDSVINNALAARPGSALDFLAFPGTEFSLPAHYLLLLKTPTSFGGEVHELAVVEAGTARVAEVRELPVYLKTLLLSEPLHFGDYGGLTLKILWGSFALVCFAMTIVGIWGWFAKRTERRRPLSTKKARRLPIVRATRSAYWAPLLLGLLTFTGAGVALITEGAGDIFAYLLFGAPLAALLYTGVRRYREERARHG
jgi:uncharacterized iron-regulated membrane protein